MLRTVTESFSHSVTGESRSFQTPFSMNHCSRRRLLLLLCPLLPLSLSLHRQLLQSNHEQECQRKQKTACLEMNALMISSENVYSRVRNLMQSRPFSAPSAADLHLPGEQWPSLRRSSRSSPLCLQCSVQLGCRTYSQVIGIAAIFLLRLTELSGFVP